MKTKSKVLLAIAVVTFVVTLVSLLPVDFWFVRSIDLVREPIVWFLTGSTIVALFIRDGGAWKAIALFGASILIHLWRMWPYLAIAPTQVAITGEVEDSCFDALAVNVKVKNEGYTQIAAQIERIDPDILFLMETDERWVSELQTVIDAYPHTQTHPQPEAFGMVFASRVPVEKSAIVENTYRDTPTLYATVRPADGRLVEFIGLHPKPPLPGWNTEERDENIVNAGTQTPDRLPDAIVMGDFNDVPWSRTTSKLRDAGDWRDPRIGRGAYPTFPADYLFVGWPLDQIMVKGGVEVNAFEILPDNGSDHRAVYGRFCPAANDQG